MKRTMALLTGWLLVTLAQAELPLNPAEMPAQKPAPVTATRLPASTVATNLELQVRAELVDGSILLGRPLAAEVPVQTSFATLTIPMAALESVDFPKGAEEGKLKLKNGDTLKGSIQLKTLRLETCIGRVELRMEHIARLRVKTPGGGEEVRFRTYADGLDEVHIRGDSLWFVHRSWKKPGDGDDSQEQTFINGKAWLPTWRGNTSDKFRPVDPPLPNQGEYRIRLENEKARGELRITQQPNENNNYEAVILIDDSGTPAQAWYEFTVRWSR